MSLESLRRYLQSIPPGNISPADNVEKLLAQCWDELEKSAGGAGGMQGYKLLDRMEDVVWDPPLLMFQIERHGPTAMGSVYAELQGWTVDVEKGTAEYWPWKRRLVRERDQPFKAGLVAKEIAELILRGEEDPRLKRQGGRVKVEIGTVVPATNQQTTSDRRKRFKAALEKELKPHGWKWVSGKLNTLERCL